MMAERLSKNSKPAGRKWSVRARGCHAFLVRTCGQRCWRLVSAFALGRIWANIIAPTLIAEIEEILAVAEHDNHSAWDLQSDGTYVRRRPRNGETARSSQQAFVHLVR